MYWYKTSCIHFIAYLSSTNSKSKKNKIDIRFVHEETFFKQNVLIKKIYKSNIKQKRSKVS